MKATRRVAARHIEIWRWWVREGEGAAETSLARERRRRRRLCSFQNGSGQRPARVLPPHVIPVGVEETRMPLVEGCSNAAPGICGCCSVYVW